MFRDRIAAAIIAAIQIALCQFFDFCLNHKDCPDGVCEEAANAVDALGDSRPEVFASQARVQSSPIQFDWSRIGEVAEAAKAFVLALRAFLGLDRPVG